MSFKKSVLKGPLELLLAFSAMLAAFNLALADKNQRFAMLGRGSGDTQFQMAYMGAQEAADALGIDIEYIKPSANTPEAQIESINELIDKKVSAIMISANDATALTPSLERASAEGIKIVTFDQDTESAARSVHIASAQSAHISLGPASLAHDLLKGKGSIVIVAGAQRSTTQNDWVNELVRLIEEDNRYADLSIVEIIYGDENPDVAYKEVLRLTKTHTDLAAIVSYSSIGITSASQVVRDQDLVGKVIVTGLGYPHDMVDHVLSGATPAFTMWNMVDVGYSSVKIAHGLTTGRITGKAGEVVKVGRLGYLSIEENNTAIVGAMYVYDQHNVEEAAALVKLPGL